MLGLGPGPHLEIPSSIVASRRESTNDPKHVEHPEFGFVRISRRTTRCWISLFKAD